MIDLYSIERIDTTACTNRFTPDGTKVDLKIDLFLPDDEQEGIAMIMFMDSDQMEDHKVITINVIPIETA